MKTSKPRNERNAGLPDHVYRHVTSPHRFVAAITYRGKRVYLGTFGDVDEAAEKVRLFRLEHPKMTKEPWQPGDEI